MIGKTLSFTAALVFAVVLSGATAAQAGDMKKPDPMQIAKGAKEWAQTCGQCHNLRDPKEFTDGDWSQIVNHMRTIGPIPGKRAEDIKAFLQASN